VQGQWFGPGDASLVIGACWWGQNLVCANLTRTPGLVLQRRLVGSNRPALMWPKKGLIPIRDALQCPNLRGLVGGLVKPGSEGRFVGWGGWKHPLAGTAEGWDGYQRQRALCPARLGRDLREVDLSQTSPLFAPGAPVFLVFSFGVSSPFGNGTEGLAPKFPGVGCWPRGSGLISGTLFRPRGAGVLGKEGRNCEWIGKGLPWAFLGSSSPRLLTRGLIPTSGCLSWPERWFAWRNRAVPRGPSGKPAHSLGTCNWKPRRGHAARLVLPQGALAGDHFRAL